MVEKSGAEKDIEDAVRKVKVGENAVAEKVTDDLEKAYEKEKGKESKIVKSSNEKAHRTSKEIMNSS